MKSDEELAEMIWPIAEAQDGATAEAFVKEHADWRGSIVRG